MRRILPTILALITGKDRYFPRIGIDFEWSDKSWTHNTFRVFELVLGRQVGIRLESTCGVDENGVSWAIVHTFEASVAYTETFIRNIFALPKFRLVKVYLPALAPAGFGVPTRTPYLFAIAYDTVARGTGAGGASSVTYSHTVTGSNPAIAIMGCQNNVPIATSSSATYAAVSATQATTKSNASQNTWMDIDVLGNCATGANNVVWTANQTAVSAFSLSFSGAASSPIGAFATPTTWVTTTSASATVATTAANSLVVDNVQNNNATPTASGSGQTIRNNASGVGGNRFYGSTMTTTTTGNYTPGYTWSGNTDGTMLALEIKAFVASGPANLKSRDTNLKANIKSIDTNLIANVKSLDTNV